MGFHSRSSAPSGMIGKEPGSPSISSCDAYSSFSSGPWPSFHWMKPILAAPTRALMMAAFPAHLFAVLGKVYEGTKLNPTKLV